MNYIGSELGFLVPPASHVQISSSAPLFQAPSVYILDLMYMTKLHTQTAKTEVLYIFVFYVLNL